MAIFGDGFILLSSPDLESTVTKESRGRSAGQIVPQQVRGKSYAMNA